jgi:tRNA (guanine37-N1)-methyltransferase
MWFGVVSILPEIVRAGAEAGVFGRAVAEGNIGLDLIDPREFTRDRHRTVDDRPYGGGPGMVLMVEPVNTALDEAVRRSRERGIEAPIIYLSPEGERLNQNIVKELSEMPGMILLCGRFEGVDERVVRTRVDRELSIGDFVVTGGELPALVVMDAVARYVPGTLGNSASVIEESHLDGLLDYPHYTRPENTGGESVPPVLLSGDHAAIDRWRLKQALERTWRKRPDLLAGRGLSDIERELLTEVFDELSGDDL